MAHPAGGSGLAVAAAFHRELVGPMPGGCRLTVLVDEADRAVTPVVDELLTRLLPEAFRGYRSGSRADHRAMLTATYHNWLDAATG